MCLSTPISSKKMPSILARPRLYLDTSQPCSNLEQGRRRDAEAKSNGNTLLILQHSSLFDPRLYASEERISLYSVHFQTLRISV